VAQGNAVEITARQGVHPAWILFLDAQDPG